MAIGNGREVVLVDDDPADIMLARRCYGISTLDNPWLDFERVARFQDWLIQPPAMPALVLLDLHMPDMSGLDLVAWVRSHVQFQDLPILCMLTSSDLAADQQRAATLGANGFRTKPTSAEGYVALFDGLFELDVPTA